MTDFLVSARKYRPKTFSEVIGQENTCSILANAIKTKKHGHAYLFCGPRGVGKTTCARIFAKAINCLSTLPNGDPCDKCKSCKEIIDGNSLNISELDAASNNSVDNIRELTESTHFYSGVSGNNVFIIDEIHMLSKGAFNAFLKTLEEPPPKTIFILATTEKQKIPATIISRCQIINFEGVVVETISNNLEKIAKKEGYNFEKQALDLISIRANGSLRDSLSIFDTVVSFVDKNISYEKTADILNVVNSNYLFELFDYITNSDPYNSIKTLTKIFKKNHDPSLIIENISEHLVKIITSEDTSNNDEKTDKYKVQFKEINKTLGYYLLDILYETHSRLKEITNKELWVQMGVVKMCSLFDSEKKKP